MSLEAFILGVTFGLVIMVGVWLELGMLRRVVLGWRRWRRKKKGLCWNCGYDLTGNVSGVCPECGTKVHGATASEIIP